MMKVFQHYRGLARALALISLLTLSACSDDEVKNADQGQATVADTPAAVAFKATAPNLPQSPSGQTATAGASSTPTTTPAAHPVQVGISPDPMSGCVHCHAAADMQRYSRTFGPMMAMMNPTNWMNPAAYLSMMAPMMNPATYTNWFGAWMQKYGGLAAMPVANAGVKTD